MHQYLTLLLLTLIPISVYAHGITNEIVAIILLMSLWPLLIAIITSLVGLRKKRLKQNHKPWYKVSVVFVVIQILLLVYFMVIA